MTAPRSLVALAVAALAAPLFANPLTVTVVEVAVEEQVVPLAITGTITAAETVSVGFREGGRVTELWVDTGDSVSAGDRIAQIDPTQARLARDAAQAALNGAQATAETAQTDYARDAELLRRGVITRARLDASLRARDVAQAAVGRAAARLADAEESLEDTTLTAPVSGVIVAREVEIGEVVSSASSIVNIAQDQMLEARFMLPGGIEVDALMGQPVDLIPVDAPQIQMTGSVTEIAPIVDEATGSVEMRARITDATGLDTDLLGSAVRGRITAAMPEGISIPADALVETGEGPAVWVMAGETTAELQPITVGRYDTHSVMVAEGLSPGMQVVTEGAFLLYPGRELNPVAEGAQ
ncbi:efflux RND transporter periplasmic adaptor subunit [Paracoccaceae bacterium GXU_MW_L88]